VSAATFVPNVTLPVELLPPITEEGEKETAVGMFAVTDRVPVLDPPFAAADTGTLVANPTGLVVIVHVPALDPDGTVIDAGMEATAL
jgi:hypothetical protein